MKIRKFRAEDATELARMHRATIKYINRRDYSPEQIAVWSRRTSVKRFRDTMNEFVRFVAIDNDKIVGYCDFKKDGEFGGLYVHKDYQGKGVGKSLLKKIEVEAYKFGIREFHLLSTITARNFYRKQGYIEIKRTMFKMGNSETNSL